MGALGAILTTTGVYTEAEVDAIVATVNAGIDNKDWVDTSTEGVGNITLSGEQTLNGLLTSTSRVLVTEQTLPEENGIYITAAGAWSRSTDADSDDEVTNGLTTKVDNSGSDVYRHSYLLVTADPITVGVTGLTFKALPDHEQATETVVGIAEIATQAETDAGVDDTRFVTPLKLAAYPRTLNDVVTDGGTTDKDIEITDTTKGIILTAPNASRWRVTVDNSGNLITTSI